MKLRRLDLRAFGPFTQQVLDFGAAGAGGANLHLIYGANEAGKSSALRALGDLRFGIPMRSTDNFIHPHPQMRIGAVFEVPGDGQPLTLLRSKGRGQTLFVADPLTGEPLAQQALPAALQRWLTDGLEREPFEAMFSLNHQRLREGGQALIDGQGELGAALAEWQKAVLALRERAEQLRGTRHDLALLATQSAQARADLRAALDDKSDGGDACLTIRPAAQLTGTCDSAGADLLAQTAAAALAELATHLAALSQQAAVQVQVWEAAQAAQQERERQQQLVAPRLDEARRQLVSLHTEVSEGQAACGADAQALWLISPIRSGSITFAGDAGVVTIQPAVLRARLDELAEFERRHVEWQRLQLAQQAVDVRAARLAQSLAELALRLGDPAAAASDESARPTRGAVPGLTAFQFDASADAIRRYERRLLEAQDAEHQRAVLLRDRAAADERLQRAQARAAAAAQTLLQLCELAARADRQPMVAAAEVSDEGAQAGWQSHVVSETDLPELEEQSAQRRAMESELALIDQQLAQAASRPLDTLRAELAGRDLAELDAERQQAEQACAQADAALQRALGSAQAAQQALDAVDASAQAAEAREAIELVAARWRDAVRPWARLRLAHALLDSATRRFRERAQAPMLGAASSLFATMTGGRYVRLRVDDADGRPVLQAERAGDAAKPIGVPALSEGTADQLYLALRLAALGLRHGADAAAPVMPLVLDDVLMTADDERAACILQALAAHARTGQVLLFTHHRHLIELARERLDGAAFMVHRL
jgi:uncharacterized protein YhaN